MRSLRHELVSAALVMSLPLALCLAFPFEAIGFRATPAATATRASFAFVTLSEEEEQAALQAAKTSWQFNVPAGQRMRMRLPLGGLPDEQVGLRLDVMSEGLTQSPTAPLGYPAPPWEPSARAKEPVKIQRAPSSDATPAFTREELLKLN